MIEVFRVNVTTKNLVGFATRNSDISFLVKTIQGVEEVLEDELKKFESFNKSESFISTMFKN